MARDRDDEAFIEQVRSREGQRLTVATVTVVIGLAVLGLAWFITNTSLRYVVPPELLPSDTANPDIILTVDKMSYWWGVAVGFSTALAWLLALYLVFSGISHSMQGKTERRLLEMLGEDVDEGTA